MYTIMYNWLFNPIISWTSLPGIKYIGSFSIFNTYISKNEYASVSPYNTATFQKSLNLKWVNFRVISDMLVINSKQCVVIEYKSSKPKYGDLKPTPGYAKKIIAHKSDDMQAKL